MILDTWQNRALQAKTARQYILAHPGRTAEGTPRDLETILAEAQAYLATRRQPRPVTTPAEETTHALT